MRHPTLLTSLALLSVVACHGDPEVGRVAVAAERAPCTGLANQMCLVVTDLDDPAATPEFLYFGIVGYQHQWGQAVEVDVTIEDVVNPPADGSSVRWTARDVRVTSTAARGATFTLRFPVRGEPWFFAGVAGAVDLVDGTEVGCAPALCAQVTDPLAGALDVGFAHDGAGGLDLVSVTPVP